MRITDSLIILIASSVRRGCGNDRNVSASELVETRSTKKLPKAIAASASKGTILFLVFRRFFHRILGAHVVRNRLGVPSFGTCSCASLNQTFSSFAPERFGG